MKFKPHYIPVVCRWLLCMVLLCCVGCSAIAQAQDEPAYNRVQYRKYHWRALHTKRFHLYFPADAADSLYRFVYSQMPDAIEHIKKATLKELPRNLNIIIYPSADQLYETNIGGYETKPATFPTFVNKGSRVVIAYNGSYADLKRQLYEGLSRAIWESQLKDDDKETGGAAKTTGKEAAQSGNIPYWFKEGAIKYFAAGWQIAEEDRLRNSFEEKDFGSWQQLLNYEPRLGGQAFCYFLEQRYYPTAPAQTVFQLKKKKSLTRALRLVTKHEQDSLFRQCFAFYRNRYKKADALPVSVKDGIALPHGKGIVQQVLLSPGKDHVAYVLLANGKRTVFIYNTKDHRTKKIAIYKLPPWLDDHSADQYPLISWHKDGRQLYVAKPRKGKLTISRYAVTGEMQERTILPGLDGITDIQPLSDREFLLTAYRKGQSDIVSYNDNKEKYTAFTDDDYDDMHPVLTGNGNDILFISDRPEVYRERKIFLIGVGYKKDTLWQGLYSIKHGELKPVAIDTNYYIKWDKPVLLKDGQVLLTNTATGAERNVVFNYMTGIKTVLGNYHPFQYLQQSNEISFYQASKDSIYTRQQPMNDWIKENATKPGDTTGPWLEDHKALMARQAREDSLLKKGRDTTHYFMDDVFTVKTDTAAKPRRRKQKNAGTRSDGTEPYILQLQSAYFTAQVNNDYFINRYQPYANYQGAFDFPEVGGMTKGGFTDLLENHHFTIAYKLPAATEGSDFFVRYENTKKKVDWGFSYFRKVETLKPDPNRNWVDDNGNKYPQNAKAKTHYYEFFLKYPLTYYSSLGLQLAVRQDKTIFLATDKYTLDFPPLESTWSITTLSYKINKLKPTIANLYKGFKAESYVDVFKGFSQQEAFLLGMSVHGSYHQPLYKYITLVGQLHAGYSVGDERILYNLGGVDNNVTPRTDTSVHFAQKAPYAFQTLVTPFRGYFQNSLYGNEYLLCNLDVYFPLFQTLIPIETPLPFINNLQLGTFTDAATARETYLGARQTGKWLQSFGLSARTTLAGYPLRIDLAWPGTLHKKPVLYFSLKL